MYMWIGIGQLNLPIPAPLFQGTLGSRQMTVAMLCSVCAHMEIRMHPRQQTRSILAHLVYLGSYYTPIGTRRGYLLRGE